MKGMKLPTGALKRRMRVREHGEIYGGFVHHRTIAEIERDRLEHIKLIRAINLGKWEEELLPPRK